MVKYSPRLIALCSAANFINAADRVLMPIAIVPMTDEFHWNLYWQGWILSSFAFGYFTSQIIGASAATRFGGKPVLLFAVLLWSVSTLVTPYVAGELPLLLASRVLLGLGEGLGLPTVFHMFAHQVAPEERGRAFGYLVAAGSVGQTLASLLCPHLHWEHSFRVFGALGIIWCVAWVSLHTECDGGSSSSKPRSETQGESVLPLIAPKVTRHHVRWTEFVTHWPLWSIYIAHFAMNWSNYIVMQWLPTYLARTLGANRESISLTAVPYIVNSLVGVVAGHLADSLAMNRSWSVLSVRRLMTTIGLLGPGLFLLALGAVDNLLLAVLIVSLSMGLCACNSAGHLSNHAEVAPNNAGVTFAVSNTLATIPGILCGPLTAELVVKSHGRWFPVFVLAAGINFTGAVIYASQSSASQVI